MKVLVVDDMESIRTAIERLLLSHGHQVHLVASGKEALALLGHYAPDIVITDWRMPGMSGEELIRHIKASNPHLSVILMTGVDLSPAVRRVITGAGANAILSKPFTQEELERAFTQAMLILPAPS